MHSLMYQNIFQQDYNTIQEYEEDKRMAIEKGYPYSAQDIDADENILKYYIQESNIYYKTLYNLYIKTVIEEGNENIVIPVEILSKEEVKEYCMVLVDADISTIEVEGDIERYIEEFNKNEWEVIESTADRNILEYTMKE